MRQSRRRLLTVLAAGVLVGSASSSARVAPITRHRFRALGTDAQITLVGNPVQAEAAVVVCRNEVTAIENAFSLYDPNSMLSQLNRTGSVKTNSLFSTLLQHSLAIAETTGGAFDPTVQPLWRAYATGGNLEEARKNIGWHELLPTSGQTADIARFNRPNMAASFNGIAQGFAADQISAILAQHGFPNTLVDLGEFAIKGAKSGKPWLLGIRDPSTKRIIAQVKPVAAIATSEPHGTLVAGQPHIIDPFNRAGERWVSVTVEARQAWCADALSTAIAASPMDDAKPLLVAGGATRAWLLAASGVLHEWLA